MGGSILYSSVIKRHISVSADFFFSLSQSRTVSGSGQNYWKQEEFGGDAEGGSSPLLGLRLETDWV